MLRVIMYIIRKYHKKENIYVQKERLMFLE